jgi:hypothetical protein
VALTASKAEPIMAVILGKIRDLTGLLKFAKTPGRGGVLAIQNYHVFFPSGGDMTRSVNGALVVAIAAFLAVLLLPEAGFTQEATSQADPVVEASTPEAEVTPEAEAQPPAADATVEPAGEPAVDPEEQPADEPTSDEPAVQPADEPTTDQPPVQALTDEGTADSEAEADPEALTDEIPEEGLVAKEPKPSKLKLDGYYWVHFGMTSGFAMDETGARDGLNKILDHRLRIRPTLAVSKSVDIVANVDILAGQLAGDTTNASADILLVPRHEKRFTSRSTLRELYLEWHAPVGNLRVGQMHSHWGLGLVANNGEDDLEAFADSMLGDRVERIQWTMKPGAFFDDSLFAKNLYLSLAADLVFSDDHASLIDGDLAWQGVGALYWNGNVIEEKYDMFTGVYIAYRNQKYANKDRLEVMAFDAFTSHSVALGSAGVRLNVAAEGALQVGKTDAFLGERAKKGVDVLAWGLAARAEVEVPKYRIIPGLELGLASGDADREDGLSRAFSFDPDYKVGMILFPELLGRTTAWSAHRVTDPSLQGRPSKGYDLAITNGAVTNAFYLYPRIKITAAKGLDIRVAFLWARALAYVSDPFNSNITLGGYPVGYRGGKPSKDIGYEIDAGISYTTPKVWGPFAFRIGLQGGLARPGAAFNDAFGDSLGSIYKIRALLDLTF